MLLVLDQRSLSRSDATNELQATIIVMLFFGLKFLDEFVFITLLVQNSPHDVECSPAPYWPLRLIDSYVLSKIQLATTKQQKKFCTSTSYPFGCFLFLIVFYHPKNCGNKITQHSKEDIEKLLPFIESAFSSFQR